jgi:hypothetical protein
MEWRKNDKEVECTMNTNQWKNYSTRHSLTESRRILRTRLSTEVKRRLLDKEEAA